MKTWKIVIPAAVALLLAGQALAQGEEERLAAIEAREAEVEMRLREAEEKMAEAARTIAELTSERLPQVMRIEKRIMDKLGGKPVLGIAIGVDSSEKGPVEGVSVQAVTPGSAAADAGLRSGDVITAVNGESLSAASAGEANERLLDFMKGIEEGDVIDVEYLRDGNVAKVEVEPRLVANRFFEFRGPDVAVAPVPEIHAAPALVERFKHGMWFGHGGGSWADMELVELNEGLGKYFGTDEGLLVVSAPESNALQLEDGDVIQSIDGREPKSVGHAMRILSSYQSGEKLELTIMRDKRRKKLEIEMPEDERTGNVFEFHTDPRVIVEPTAAPNPASPPVIILDSDTT
ncbi:MAG: PDZ domain-containing protein [Woeseiaceae bacterium]|nr:PDZ domain-containing protein [Woeseiaceae bacterium]